MPIATATFTALFVVPIAAPPALDMTAAVQAALARAPALEARRGIEAEAHAQAEVARSAYLPRISFDASYLARAPVNKLPIELPAIPGVEPIGAIDDVHHVQLGLRVGYRVFDLSRGPRVEAAEANQVAQVAQTAANRADLAFGVRATFLAALYAREVRDIAQSSLQVAEEELRRAELRTAAGVDSQVALAQARVRLAQLQAQHRQANSELARHRARLASLLGLDELPGLSGDLDALGGEVGEARIEQHPEVRRLEALEAASNHLATSRARTFVPSLTIMGAASLQYPRNLRVELGPVYEAGLALSWPLFDGFARQGEVEAHEARAAAIDQLTEAKKEDLRRDLIDLEARATTAQAALASSEEILTQTQVYLRVAKAALQAGAGTQLDVHTAELGLDQARVAKKRALFDRAVIRAEALRVYGLAVERRGDES